MLRSDLCDYTHPYIVLEGKINVRATVNTDIGQKDGVFKNNVPFRSCIRKITSTLIENAEDLDIVMQMLICYNIVKNYSVTSGSLWNYYRDEINDVDDNASHCKSFKYKIKIIEKKEARPARPALPAVNPDGSQPPQPPQPPVPPLNTEVTILLKDLSNFWRSLDLFLIKCVDLDLKW